MNTMGRGDLEIAVDVVKKVTGNVSVRAHIYGSKIQKKNKK